jgi:phosphoenolpyruvate carboxykinase (GTP)
MRVLGWLLARVEGRSGGHEHVFGLSPRYEDLHWQGLDFTREQFASVMSIDIDAWRDEMALHGELFKLLAHHLPDEMRATKARIEARLAA